MELLVHLLFIIILETLLNLFVENMLLQERFADDIRNSVANAYESSIVEKQKAITKGERRNPLVSVNMKKSRNRASSPTRPRKVSY